MDLDGDGKQDLVLSQTKMTPFYSSRGIQVLMSNGDGTFRDETVPRLSDSSVDPTGAWVQFIKAIDVNGDGFLDLFAQGNFGNNPPMPFLWLNNGQGHFVTLQDSILDSPLFMGVMGKSRTASLPDLIKTFVDDKGNPGYATYPNISAIKPASGWWYNPSELGRGYALEVRGSAVFFAAFLYDPGGEARWYVANGAISGSVFEADLQRYSGSGTELWGSTEGVAPAGSVGRIRVAFSSTSNGVMTWPGGTTAIQRFDFVQGGVLRGPDDGMPESGWYVDTSQMGKGWHIEFQGRQAYIGFFSYMHGRPVWLVAFASLSGAVAPMLEAPLSRYCCGGSFIGGGASGIYDGSAGQMTLSVRDRTNAVVRLPDGSVINLSRFRF